MARGKRLLDLLRDTLQPSLGTLRAFLVAPHLLLKPCNLVLRDSKLHRSLMGQGDRLLRILLRNGGSPLQPGENFVTGSVQSVVAGKLDNLIAHERPPHTPRPGDNLIISVPTRWFCRPEGCLSIFFRGELAAREMSASVNPIEFVERPALMMMIRVRHWRLSDTQGSRRACRRGLTRSLRAAPVEFIDREHGDHDFGSMSQDCVALPTRARQAPHAASAMHRRREHAGGSTL
jgi:hypothetical protein